MVELPILAKIISRETYFFNYVCVATVVVLVEWSILAKNPSQNSIFKNVCRKQWLNWLIRQIWILANSNFRIVCVAKAVEMVDLLIFSEYFLDWLIPVASSG